MSESLTVIDRGAGQALSVAHMQSRSELVRQVMANVLEDGKDYGRIPGTDKPTLYKPGAEKLCLTFALAPSEPQVEDLSTCEAIRYRVQVPIKNVDDRVLAVGIGEASTDEEKYRWKRPVCDEEFDEAPTTQRRTKWAKGRDGAYQVKQIRTSPADLANTVLKMAHKRALIAATLMATGASSVFNQDLEDFTKELQEHLVDEEQAPPKQVKRASDRKPATTHAPAAGSLVTPPLKVKDVRVFGKDKNNYAVTLVGHGNEYTTKDAALALDLEKFKGTDHLLRITYVDNDFQGKVYHNVKTFEVVDAAPAGAPSAGGGAVAGEGAAPPLVAGDIPFSR